MSATGSVSDSLPLADRDPVKVEALVVEPITLSCPYCAAALDARSFHVWPSQPRLITGACDGCGRELTLPSRWLTAPPVVRQPEPRARS